MFKNLKRIVRAPVTVLREGAYVRPAIGEVFPFTSNEVTAINKGNPKALEHIIVAGASPVEKAPKADVEYVASSKGD